MTKRKACDREKKLKREGRKERDCRLQSVFVSVNNPSRTGVICVDLGTSSTASAFYSRVIAETSEQIFTPVRFVRTRYKHTADRNHFFSYRPVVTGIINLPNILRK